MFIKAQNLFKFTVHAIGAYVPRYLEVRTGS